MDATTSVSEKVFRVKSVTAPPELGSAIAHAVSGGSQVVLKCVGAGATNQAIKSIPIAQSYVISFGIELIEKIHFFHGTGPSGEITGICIRVMAA